MQPNIVAHAIIIVTQGLTQSQNSIEDQHSQRLVAFPSISNNCPERTHIRSLTLHLMLSCIVFYIYIPIRMFHNLMKQMTVLKKKVHQDQQSSQRISNCCTLRTWLLTLLNSQVILNFVVFNIPTTLSILIIFVQVTVPLLHILHPGSSPSVNCTLLLGRMLLARMTLLKTWMIRYNLLLS